jgi:TRAP-type mannitol/chloroaromatic compound transport system permease small subunit
MKVINRFTERVSLVISTLSVVLMSVITYEVVARYVFNAPTAWSYDLSYMIGGSFWVLAAAYAILHNTNVRVDVLYVRLKRKSQLLIDTILTAAFFFPMWLLILHSSIYHTLTAIALNERSSIGHWAPSMIPFRLVGLIGVILIVLQGASWFLTNIRSLRSGQEEDKLL